MDIVLMNNQATQSEKNLCFHTENRQIIICQARGEQTKQNGNNGSYLIAQFNKALDH